jgi:hypothetical protein
VTRIFTVEQYAAACGIPETKALLFLQDFERIHVVERRTRSGWVVTRRGLMLSRGLALAAPERRVA